MLGAGWLPTSRELSYITDNNIICKALTALQNSVNVESCELLSCSVILSCYDMEKAF